MQFSNPNTLQEAYSLLAGSDWKILSGGTDFYPALGNEVADFNVLDISQITAIRTIEMDDAGNWHIGALVTWSDIIGHDFPPSFDGLKLAAKEVGSIQIQNRATVVGNICNASPAADGVPPLLTLGSIVKIGSAKGERELPLAKFILGNRETDLMPGEMVVGLKIPAEGGQGKSHFMKLGARKYLVISIAMVAVRLVVDGKNKIEDVAISVGSCSAVAMRMNELERALIGVDLSDDLASIVHNEYFGDLTPIDDVRATREFRIDACKELVVRTLNEFAGDL